MRAQATGRLLLMMRVKPLIEHNVHGLYQGSSLVETEEFVSWVFHLFELTTG